MPDQNLTQFPLFRSLVEGDALEAGKSERCFVAGPFDSSDPDVRRRAETAWKYIVRPALLDSDYAPYRVLATEGEDRIAKETVDALLANSLALVIATHRTFGVDYALSVTRATRRPVVQLVEDVDSIAPETHLADDGSVVVHFSLDPDALIGGTNVAVLQQAIADVRERQIASLVSAVERPAPEAPAAALEAAADSRPRPVTDDQRAEMMADAASRIDVMGVANLHLALRPDVLTLARGDRARGLEIRILQCAPNNPGLPSIVGARDAQHLANVKGEIEAAAEAWKRLAEQDGCTATVTLRRATTSVPLSSAIITDKAMAATPYLFSRMPVNGPTYVASAGSAEHESMQEEFNALWNEAIAFYRNDPKPTAVRSPPASVPLGKAAVTSIPFVTVPVTSIPVVKSAVAPPPAPAVVVPVSTVSVSTAPTSPAPTSPAPASPAPASAAPTADIPEIAAAAASTVPEAGPALIGAPAAVVPDQPAAPVAEPAPSAAATPRAPFIGATGKQAPHTIAVSSAFSGFQGTGRSIPVAPIPNTRPVPATLQSEAVAAPAAAPDASPAPVAQDGEASMDFIFDGNIKAQPSAVEADAKSPIEATAAEANVEAKPDAKADPGAPPPQTSRPTEAEIQAAQRPAVIPPVTNGLLKGFSSLRGAGN